ncbi:MAG: aldehyde ferredoxin oxidoreductase family protein [Candidatus Hodarchaeota archaeon]
MDLKDKILRIDLSSKTISKEDIQEEDFKKYIGGQGIAAAIFIREVPPSTDAFDADNLLIFSAGPFCGTAIPLGGRHFVLGKSPLTGIIGEASAGGHFGKELRSAGFDLVVIKGKSDTPVYLSIKDGEAELKDASGLWGKGTKETEESIKAELGDDKIKVASIGPAGENQVRFACIINEEERAAARCGLGAVMGSKNLKAIATRGTGKVLVNDEEKVKEESTNIRALLKESSHAIFHGKVGTPAGMDTMISMGDVPIKNYTMSRWKGTKNIGYEALADRGEIKRLTCNNCPVGCSGMIEYEGNWIRWPEFETLAMLGALLQVDDLEAIIKWNMLANDFGMDVISLGGVLGGFLEAIERGILDINKDEFGFKKTSTPEEGESYPIWGDAGAIEKAIKMISAREGIGNDLAEGIKRFLERKGLPAELGTHGKGLEVPAHEPRACDTSALDFATNPRGAYHGYHIFHLHSSMNFKKDLGLDKMIDRFSGDTAEGLNGLDVTVDAVVKLQDAGESHTACGGCIFGFEFLHEITPWIKALNAITGIVRSLDDFMAVGRNLINLKRKYAIECGITKADDTIGPRFFQSIKKGGTKKHVPQLNELVSKYYAARGWDSEGKPV